MSRKAFSKINNPKDKALIRLFVKDRLVFYGVTKINGKPTDKAKNIELEMKYIQYFKTEPVRDYLNTKRGTIEREMVFKPTLCVLGNEEYGVVSICFTTDPERKIEYLEKNCPFTVKRYYVGNGTQKKEKELHRLFKKYRINKEWFKIEGDLIPFLSETLQKGRISMKNLGG